MKRTRHKRETAHLFDGIFKRLKDYSDKAVINFINGLFDKDHPIDSTVEYPNTESVSRSLRKRRADIIVIIGGVHSYLIEAQISDDENIALRVFEYGMAEGLRARRNTLDDSNCEKITVKFPEARVIYWETTNKTPDEAILSLEFPNGEHYDYVVRTLKFLDHEIYELERRKLAILLPFYVLKLRKRAVRARSAKTRAKLAREAKEIMDELMAAAERAKDSGLIGENDWLPLLEYTERIYRELYGNYSEFREADTVLQDKILTYSEEAKLIGIQEGMAKGRMEGMAKGRKEGEIEGWKKGMFDAARKMLGEGISAEIIRKCTGLDESAIMSLR
jgi:hypothetical protein